MLSLFVCLSVSLPFPLYESFSEGLPSFSRGLPITFVLFLQPIEGDSGVGTNAAAGPLVNMLDAWLLLGDLLQNGDYSTLLPRQETPGT